MSDKPFAYERFKTVCSNCETITTANCRRGDGGIPGIYVECGTCNHINWATDKVE